MLDQTEGAIAVGLGHRLVKFYNQDWADTNPAGPSVTKHGLPAPVDSPPLPDWIYEAHPTSAPRTAIPIP